MEELIPCGMVNPGGSSHVIAALQMLLHIEEMRAFLINDVVHRAGCRSLLCSTCALWRLLCQVMEGNCVAPSFFVAKWKRVQVGLPEGRRSDAHETLFLTVTGLRQEHLGRLGDKMLSMTDVNETISSQLFAGKKVMEVRCHACPTFSRTQEFLSVEVDDINALSLEDLVLNNLYKTEKMACSSCTRSVAEWKTVLVDIPQCLLVRVSNCRRSVADLKSISFGKDRMKLQALMSQELLSSFATMTWLYGDHSVRQFEDAKVKSVNAAAFLNSTFQGGTVVTFLFVKEVPKVLQQVGETENAALSLLNKPGTHEVLTAPDADDIDCAGLQISEEDITTAHRKNKDCGTQTRRDVKDVATQTGPMVEFERCKLHKNFAFFTGLCVDDFYALYNLIGGNDVISQLKMKYKEQTPMKRRPRKLSSEDMLHMFLLRLRRGLPLEELAFIFQLARSTASEVCYVMLRLIYLTFKGMEDKLFVSAAEQRKNMPKVMKPFKNLRVIVDGASFFIQTPSNFEMQGNTFSAYKHHNVIIATIGIACNGTTIFCSPGMEGAMSDKEVVIKSGLLEKLEEGDGLMSDRGYELTAELEAIGCNFFKPPVLGDRQEFTAEEEILTKGIAAARIYTEHAIADIKDNRLLQGVIPMNLYAVAPQLIYVAAFLRNFYPVRIRDKKVSVVDDKVQKGSDNSKKKKAGSVDWDSDCSF